MSSEETITTTIEQGDAALEAQDNAVGFDPSSYDHISASDDGDGDDSEDPVTRGQGRANSMPMYRAVVPRHTPRRMTKRSSSTGPSGHIPNLTPGARRIP